MGKMKRRETLLNISAESAWLRCLEYAVRHNLDLTVSPPANEFGWFVTLTDAWGATQYLPKHNERGSISAAVRHLDALILAATAAERGNG